MMKKPHPYSTTPIKPSGPVSRTWRRYIPRIPTSARTAIAIVKTWTIFHVAVVTFGIVSSGWMNWRRTNTSPATTAATPAARNSWVWLIAAFLYWARRLGESRTANTVSHRLPGATLRPVSRPRGSKSNI
jgi:hypothetical protein